MHLPEVRWPPLNVISSFSNDSLGPSLPMTNGANSAASGVFSANRIHYYPFVLAEVAQAVKMSYIVGAVANGTADLGIYDWQKNKLVSTGPTAQGTINALQELDITDTVLLPGQYWMAIVGSSATGTTFNSAAVDELAYPAFLGYAEAGGSATLPANAAFSTSVSSSPTVHCMGVHFNTLV